MKKYGQLIKDLRAKNLTDTRIKEAILEKAKKEINNFQMPFKSFKVKADAGAEAGKVIEIEGYASTKDIDRYGDVVNPKAFEETIDLFMTNPVMLLQHDHNKRIGDFTELNIDENGLYVKGEVKYTAGDDELFAKIENKSLRGFSIGFRVLEAEFQDLTDEKGNIIDWIFIINKLDLVEISVVNVPANPYTLMKSIEDLGIKSAEEVEVENLEKENDNINDNQEENEKANEEENNEEDIEVEAENKEKSDAEDEAEAEKDKNNIDENKENDIVAEEEEPLENPTEKKDGEEEAEEDSKAFTTKMIEKIVEAKFTGSEKAFKTLVEKEVKNLTEEFEKKLEAVKSDLEKELDQIVELVKQVKDTEQNLVDQITSTVKGKGFINFKTTKQKETESNRLAYILSGVKNNKF